jgi:hypothetical protein
MSADKELVELKLDEANELLFKVSIQGASAPPSAVRLVCESEGLSYLFEGHATQDGEIRFVVPALKDKVNEGTTYASKIEVLVENRYFSPVQFDVKFKQSLKVVSEGIRVNPSKTIAAPVDNEIKVAVQLKQAPKPVQETVQKPSPLKEKVDSKKTATGLTAAQMEEVSRNLVRKMLGKT